jgi:ADP-ribosyl-[dinitrogen reductase] hydrolase
MPKLSAFRYLHLFVAMKKRDYVKDVLLGVAVGDALGVPVEFISRKTLSKNPVTGMQGYGTHSQLPGTWSDDTSLTLCLAETLCHGYNLQHLAGTFVNWKEHAYWSARGNVFDIGIATSEAIHQLLKGTTPVLAGGIDEESNGNGSLMRILPLIFFIADKPIEERFNYIREVSSLTHRHIRSVIACFIYLEYGRNILQGFDKEKAYGLMQSSVSTFLKGNNICTKYELDKFHRLLEYPGSDQENAPLHKLKVDDISSTGYVLNTLEASLWCILQTNSYKEAVLKAVNLGDDTDTTAAVTGGLAGLLYGWETIPKKWLNVLAKREEITDISSRLNLKMGTSKSD